MFRYDHDPILGYNDDSLIMLMQAKILYIQITYQYNIFQVSNTFSTNYYNNMYIKSIISWVDAYIINELSSSVYKITEYSLVIYIYCKLPHTYQQWCLVIPQITSVWCLVGWDVEGSTIYCKTNSRRYISMHGPKQ